MRVSRPTSRRRQRTAQGIGLEMQRVLDEARLHETGLKFWALHALHWQVLVLVVTSFFFVSFIALTSHPTFADFSTSYAQR